MSERTVEGSSEAVASARAGYEEFNHRDHARLLARLTPDFEWHEAPEIPGPKTTHDRDEFGRYLRGFDQLWEEFEFAPRELEASGQAVYARVTLRGRGRASAQEIELEIHHVWHLRDGLFTRMDAFLDRDEARARAGLD